MESTSASIKHNIRPVIYLDSKTTVEGGNGSLDNPYVLGRGI